MSKSDKQYLIYKLTKQKKCKYENLGGPVIVKRLPEQLFLFLDVLSKSNMLFYYINILFGPLVNVIIYHYFANIYANVTPLQQIVKPIRSQEAICHSISLTVCSENNFDVL